VNPRAILPVFTPLVLAWASWQRRRAVQSGVPLDAEQSQIAVAVGVREPHRIRLCVGTQVPIPGGAWVDRIAAGLGLPAAAVDGLTLGHTIFIRSDAMTPQLLAHECRHVHQCELAGSLRAFLADYLREVADFGYANAPLEADARQAAAAWGNAGTSRV
jgi:hypothetical protein